MRLSSQNIVRFGVKGILKLHTALLTQKQFLGLTWAASFVQEFDQQ